MGLLDAARSFARSVSPGFNLIEGVVGLISGSQPSAQAAVTSSQAALLSGGTAGRVLSTGSSVGPVGALAGAFDLGTAVEVGRAVAPIVARRVGVPVPAFLQQEVAAGRGGIRTITRRQGILMAARAANPGATSKKIIRSARQCGIELAAATFGLDVLDVCFLIAQPATRRSRGISAADIRSVSRTARKFSTLQHNLSHLCGPTRRYTRKK